MVRDQTVDTCATCHRRAFEWFGGVPTKATIDNAKCAITKACARDPEVQRAYAECAEGYGFKIDPCSPRDPQKKRIVEAGVKHVKHSFLPLRRSRRPAGCWSGAGNPARTAAATVHADVELRGRQRGAKPSAASGSSACSARRRCSAASSARSSALPLMAPPPRLERPSTTTSAVSSALAGAPSAAPEPPDSARLKVSSASSTASPRIGMLMDLAAASPSAQFSVATSAV